jgi:hypothetical protein
MQSFRFSPFLDLLSSVFSFGFSVLLFFRWQVCRLLLPFPSASAVAGEEGDCGCCGRICSLTRRGRPMGQLREERSLVRGGDGRVCWRAAGDGLLLAGLHSSWQVRRVSMLVLVLVLVLLLREGNVGGDCSRWL